MRSPLGKEVRKTFTKLLQEWEPRFLVDKTQEIGPGDLLFKLTAAPSLSFFIFLFIIPKWDEFSVELAWSEDGRWPSRMIPGSPGDSPKAGALRLALRSFWFRGPGVAPRWRLVERQPINAPVSTWLNEVPIEEVLPKVAPLVQDAIEKIRVYGGPYMEKIAEDHGVTLKLGNERR
jgi:hypothetical protein